MPTLIVENGTGVASANTYADVAYLVAYAADRGVAIPSTLEEQEQFLLQAMDYLAWFTDLFQGSKTTTTNALPWPRQDVEIDDVAFDKDSIPSQLKNAQSQLAVEQRAGVILFPRPRTSSVEGLVTEKSVGTLKKKFAFTGEGIANAQAPIKIMGVYLFLKPLLKATNQVIRTVRL